MYFNPAPFCLPSFVRIREFSESPCPTEQVPNNITHHLSTLLINRKQDVVFASLSKAFGSSHQFPLAKVVHLFYYLGVNFCRSEHRVMAGGVVREQKYTPCRLQCVLRFSGTTTAPRTARQAGCCLWFSGRTTRHCLNCQLSSQAPRSQDRHGNLAGSPALP